MKLNKQRGVALVVTLIMLSIITVVAVIFLGIARRNRASVTIQYDQTVAEFAAEAAFQRAKMDIIAQIVARRQLAAYDVMVSRGIDYWSNGIVVSGKPAAPRDPYGDEFGPVLVNTNFAGGKGPREPRHFLDLNRDGEFNPTVVRTNFYTNEMTGWGTNVLALLAGDPQWIFNLDRPDRPYGPDNPLTSRMAYFVVPSGNALDINTIHNTNSPNRTAQSGYFTRNQGTGPWEMNLAALLNELDPTVWDYDYQPYAAPGPLGRGAAFTNALQLVLRRTNSPLPLLTLNDLFTNANYLTTNGVDDLGDDVPFAGGAFGAELPAGGGLDSLTKAYAGADALRHYFTHQELFGIGTGSNEFSANLRASMVNGLNEPKTNGYKFYELLGELATDTGTENRNRLNLNWASVNPLTPWDSAKTNEVYFFTNAAQRILNTMAPDFRNWVINGVTNSITNVNMIMVSPVNFYNSSVHRVMQLAANIYDSTRPDPYPTVFRPFFTNILGTNFIAGWESDNNPQTLGTWLANNPANVPLVIGAKKGLPNFNEYNFKTDLLVTRKLELTRPALNQVPNQTNQMWIIGVSNSAAVEAWNSYRRPFTVPSSIEISNFVAVTLTNRAGKGLGGITNDIHVPPTNIVRWEGWQGVNDATKLSFILPFATNLMALSNSVYVRATDEFRQVGTNVYEPASSFATHYYTPDWTLVVSNRFVYIHHATINGVPRILDFVVLSDNIVMDMPSMLSTNAALAPPPAAGMWNSNAITALDAQVAFSLNAGPDAYWNTFGNYARGLTDRGLAANEFLQFYTGRTNVTNLVMQTPFNPVARLVHNATWQANDPLVHYHVGDLTAFPDSKRIQAVPWYVATNEAGSSSILQLNQAYRPWGYPDKDDAKHDYRLRDPSVSSANRWEFPSNKLATVGWLGRVHRGTPWQSIYFKAPRDYSGTITSDVLSQQEWFNWANMGVTRVNGGFVVPNHPANDIRLVDIFTAALTDSAAQGLLSINQPRLGAWSAALAGVIVQSNKLDDNIVAAFPDLGVLSLDQRYKEVAIDPTRGDTNAPMWRLWNAIQTERQRQGGSFTEFSQLLALPELTTESPFLRLDKPDEVVGQRAFGIDDFAYERIPQQILGLLRIGQPRVVIYAYGQALKPEHVNPSTRMIDNYQITAEFATRTVLRIEGTAQNPRAVIESFNILPPD